MSSVSYTHLLFFPPDRQAPVEACSADTGKPGAFYGRMLEYPALSSFFRYIVRHLSGIPRLRRTLRPVTCCSKRHFSQNRATENTLLHSPGFRRDTFMKSVPPQVHCCRHMSLRTIRNRNPCRPEYTLGIACRADNSLVKSLPR